MLCRAAVWLWLQVAELPPHLCNAQISYRDFKAMATLRKSIYVLSFALDFCSEVRGGWRPMCCWVQGELNHQTEA